MTIGSKILWLMGLWVLVFVAPYVVGYINRLTGPMIQGPELYDRRIAILAVVLGFAVSTVIVFW